MRPTFLLIGAMKCGTTSLYHLLCQHPQVGMSTEKEPAFFCVDEIYRRGWGWYESLFQHAAGKRAVGEASTSYSKRFQFPGTAKRIFCDLPRVKLIYVVRHPFERIESQWMHNVHMGWSPADFKRALLDPRLIDPSRYWAQINAYRDYFPDEQIKVLFFEDFKAHPGLFLSELFEFLGVTVDVPLHGAALARNPSSERESERPVLNRIRQFPFFQTVNGMFPESWRAALRRSLFTRRIVSRPRWDADSWRRVAWEIGDDIRDFLRFYGRPAEAWALGQAPGRTGGDQQPAGRSPFDQMVSAHTSA